MSNYPLEYSVQHVAQGRTGDTGALHESPKPGRRDERDSQTPSDDGSCYVHYSKSENDLEGVYLYLPFATYHLMKLIEDPNTSLIAQTLNTDGTPKRPMNAFMIFARRRRPQVSAENQTMRTGEISKILSKEWNAMGLVNNVIPVSDN
jgi:HMG (high mobility group) box